MTIPVPTEDTPQERVDKAEVLAREVKRFRWEVRGYYAITILYLISEII